MQFRIKKYPKGFVVEVQKSKWGFKRWTPFILVRGIDEPWYHSSYKYAESSLLGKIKRDTIKNSQNSI